MGKPPGRAGNGLVGDMMIDDNAELAEGMTVRLTFHSSDVFMGVLYLFDKP